MQARRSSLYVHKGPTTLFYDDFSKLSPPQDIAGTRNSSGDGTWQNSPYPTKNIKCLPGGSGSVTGHDQTNDVCVAYAIPDASLVNENRLCLKANYKIANGSGANFVTAAGLWNTTAWNTGVVLQQWKSGVGAGANVLFRIFDSAGAIDVYKSATAEIPTGAHASNPWIRWELHVQKLSETSIKVGAKVNSTTWIAPPSVHTVTAGFFANPNRPSLVIRNNNNDAEGARCGSYLINDDPDW